MKHNAWQYAVKFLILGFLSLQCPGALWAKPVFSYAKDNEAVVLRYSRTPAELEASDASTIVTVYGSGRAVVHYPQFGERKGDYETTLSVSELDELVATLVDNNVMEFDSKAIANRAASAQQDQNLVFYTADADLSEIEINLSQYTVPGKAVADAAKKKVSITDLPSMYRRFPSDPALKGLATAERRFIKIIDSDDLTPLR